MGTTIGHTSAPGALTRPSTMPRCTCPACGGLECLCRPRFFAGQLLTEEDLNRLDHYIVGKSRLHNRYLHGWGVVCGLDVVCDDCTPGVIVQPGYALSPCGDDIVVCRDTPVPVCDLIDACRRERTRDCEEPQPVGCDDAATQWVLAVCYQESPSRGTVPLRPPGGDCGCGCGCGGKGSGGCGCGGHGPANGTNGHSSGGYTSGTRMSGSYTSGGSTGGGTATAARATVATASASRASALLQCEPTVVCEGYRFRVYRLPRQNDDRRPLGALVDAFLACVKEFTDAIPTLDPKFTDHDELHDWCCDVQDALLEWFRTHPPYACDLPRRVAEVRCPNANDTDFDAAIDAARTQYLLVALEVLLACLCKALMPPCPPPAADDCVPLAVVTISTTNGCRVESICNWTVHRKYATTFPSLQYWLSILPFGRLLRESIESLCCRRFVRRHVAQPASPGVDAATGATPAATAPNASTVPPDAVSSPATFFRASPPTMARSRAFMRLAVDAIATRRQSADGRRVVLGLLGEKDAQGAPYLSELESEQALQFLVLDQMAKPTLRNLAVGTEGAFGGATVAGVMSAFFGGAAEGAPSDLAERVASLEALVEQQQERIDRLSRRGGKK